VAGKQLHRAVDSRFSELTTHRHRGDTAGRTRPPQTCTDNAAPDSASSAVMPSVISRTPSTDRRVDRHDEGPCWPRGVRGATEGESGHLSPPVPVAGNARTDVGQHDHVAPSGAEEPSCRLRSWRRALPHSDRFSRAPVWRRTAAVDARQQRRVHRAGDCVTSPMRSPDARQPGGSKRWCGPRQPDARDRCEPSERPMWMCIRQQHRRE
jgi:hypothetical protein